MARPSRSQADVWGRTSLSRTHLPNLRRAACMRIAPLVILALMMIPGVLVLLSLGSKRQQLAPVQDTGGFAAWRERLVGPPLPACRGAAWPRSQPMMRRRAHLPASAWSPELQRFLDAYARHHAAALEGIWQPAGATLVFECGANEGGLGDRTKGMVSALLIAMLSSPPRAFVLHCEVVVPLTLAWVPVHGGVNWVPSPSVLKHMQAWPHVYAMDFMSKATDAVASVIRGDATVQRAPVEASAPRAVLHSNLLVRDAFISAATDMRMRGEWYADTLPPELTWLIRSSQQASNTSANRDCDCIPLAPSVKQDHSAGASNTNVLFQLIDWWAAPSPALQARLKDVANFYRPGHEYVIAVHIRVGMPPAGATYTDPERDDVVAAPALAARCADSALSKLKNMYGSRPGVLWFVASDHPAARSAMRAHAAARGKHVRVLTLHDAVDAAKVVPVLHIDKINASALAREEIVQGFLDVYAEHFLLTAAHAMVRSSSGFSATAQAWGRMMVAYQLKIGGDSGGECVDVTNTATQSVGTCDPGQTFSLQLERCT